MGEYAAGAADVLPSLDATNNKIDKCYMYKTEYIRTRQMSPCRTYTHVYV